MERLHSVIPNEVKRRFGSVLLLTFLCYILLMKKVGILALQGSFAEHGEVLKTLGQDFIWVRSKEDLESLTHLIVPGGESTTLRLLLQEYDMWEIIKTKVQSGNLQYFGTCAGVILASEFGLSVAVDRNAYGAQQSSFVDTLSSNIFPDLQGVFIRAPRFASVQDRVKILASYKDEPVLVEENNILGATFHPELTQDSRVHEYFLNL